MINKKYMERIKTNVAFLMINVNDRKATTIFLKSNQTVAITHVLRTSYLILGIYFMEIKSPTIQPRMFTVALFDFGKIKSPNLHDHQ